MHQERHCGVFILHESAQVNPGVAFLRVGTISLVEHKTDVRDDSEKMISIFAVEFHCFIVAGREQNLRPRALALNLLFLVEGVAYGFAVLLEDYLVE